MRHRRPEKTRLQKAARWVWEAYMAYGPVNDGRPEGDQFEKALEELMEATVEEKYQEEER